LPNASTTYEVLATVDGRPQGEAPYSLYRGPSLAKRDDVISRAQETGRLSNGSPIRRLWHTAATVISTEVPLALAVPVAGDPGPQRPGAVGAGLSAVGRQSHGPNGAVEMNP